MLSIHEIYAFVVNQVQTNQFLTGATLTGAIAAVFYALKSKLFNAWTLGKRFFTVSLTIHSEDALYLPISQWFYENGFDKFGKSYRIRYVDGKSIFGPSEGSFQFFYGRKLLRVSIIREDTQAPAWRSQNRELLTISYYSVSRSKKTLDTIISESIAKFCNEEKSVGIWAFSSSWSHVGKVKRRESPAVVLQEGYLEGIEADIQAFLNKKDWYLDRGIPYHRGYLLTGPPGTGKTSLVRHLAQKFGKSIYIGNGTIKSIQSVPQDSILLLEDVDSIAKIRDAARMLAGSGGKDNEDMFAPTLSELLNALDGVASSDGVIVIMTTNHPEMIDPAVLRPGRVDYRLHLGPCKKEQARRMFTKFYGDALVDDVMYASRFNSVVKDNCYTPAYLQEIFIRSRSIGESLDKLEACSVS